jgi:hypothetical protein
MEELSNRTLAVLIGIAILVSFAGTLSIPRGGIMFLGAVTNTTTGTANLSIQSVTQIRLNNNTVDFGIGYVNSSDVRCVLESNSSNRMNSTQGTSITPCDKVGGGPGFNAPAVSPNFVIENVGNINITLQVNSSFFGGAFYGNGVKGTTPGFLCDPRTSNPPQNCTLATAEYNWSAAGNDAAGACTSDSGVASRNKFNQSLNGTQQIICNSLDFNPAQNEIKVALRVAIPRDSKVGLLNDSILFQADTG